VESPSKKTKTTPSNRAAKVRVPTSVDELNEVDALTLKLRDQLKKTWNEIDDALEKLTGKRPAATTSRKRYGALKAALSHVKDEDIDVLKNCMAKVNQDIEDEKKALERRRYALLAEAMVGCGTEKYEQGTLEKTWKQIQSGGNGKD
jgi:hypothetical protein